MKQVSSKNNQLMMKQNTTKITSFVAEISTYPFSYNDWQEAKNYLLVKTKLLLHHKVANTRNSPNVKPRVLIRALLQITIETEDTTDKLSAPIVPS